MRTVRMFSRVTRVSNRVPSLIESKACCRNGRYVRPASVSTTARVARSKSFTPKTFSRCLIWCETADCDTCSSSAACLNEPVRAAASKARNALRGGTERITSLRGELFEQPHLRLSHVFGRNDLLLQNVAAVNVFK